MINMKTLNITIILIVFFVRAFCNNNNSTTTDSLGLESLNGKTFIIHQVKPDETLYRLLKKYNCTSGEVIAANPDIRSNSVIYSGQKIKFPVKQRYLAASETITSELPLEEPKANLTKSPEVVKTTVLPKSPQIYHKVMSGETLYSISRQYGKSVEEVKQLNALENSEIRIGQNLLIGGSTSIGVQVFPPAKTDETWRIPNAPTGKKVSELGIAEVINTGNRTSKYLALHRTAPIGSLVKVKNEATGDQVMVKVIGKLPETGNNHDVVIRLSPSAYQKLGPRDSRIRAEVVYTLLPEMNASK